MALPKRVEDAIASLLGSPGATDPLLRRAILQRTRTGSGELPEAPQLLPLIEKIEQRPWAVNDEDFRRLRDAGFSEEHLFELTLAAAAGAGMRRFEAGLRALEAAGADEHGVGNTPAGGR